jgi:hypothetical protein
MNLNNRLNRIEERLNPAPNRPVKYVVIHPPEDCKPGEWERSRRGYHPKFTSAEEAAAYYHGENLFFIKVVRTFMPMMREESRGAAGNEAE